ncbi:hypothetical protein HQ545_02525 [Candidatus Woesearchaeota archaeon]|nr:hypothetical protein [Candidatus Woesearchaeota archaeon]
MKYHCSICKQEITSKEYEFSMKKLGKSLCRKHQKSSNNQGLTKKESRYKEGMIKGRIAETLIEELFLSLGYNVFRYGMENTVPGIMDLLKGIKSEVATNIRRMPDFVVQHPHRKDVFFIEVKFRANEEFSFKDLPKDYPYENCYFVVVSKKHIKCITYGELKDGKKVTLTSKNYLGNRSEFELDKEVIIGFCEFAVKFFNEV